MRKKFLIIHNKMAGRLKAPMLSRVLVELEKAGADVVLKAASSVEEDIELASAAAQDRAVDAVVAAGGDSTIRGVAMGLMGEKMPLGIIPAGTGNVLAFELGLGKDPATIAQTLIAGRSKSIVPGLANGQPFLLMAGVGFDAQIVKNLNHHLKQRLRKAAYIWPTLKALAGRPPLLSIEFAHDQQGDNSWQSYSASFVVVTKARHYGGSFVIAPDADLAASEFQVVMFMSTSRLGLIRSLIEASMGRNTQVKKQLMRNGKPVGQAMKTSGVIIRASQNVRITSHEPVHMQIDGEWLGTTPLQISTSDKAIELIVP